MSRARAKAARVFLKAWVISPSPYSISNIQFQNIDCFNSSPANVDNYEKPVKSHYDCHSNFIGYRAFGFGDVPGRPGWGL
jgi:hypothetical protein